MTFSGSLLGQPEAAWRVKDSGKLRLIYGNRSLNAAWIEQTLPKRKVTLKTSVLESLSLSIEIASLIKWLWRLNTLSSFTITAEILLKRVRRVFDPSLWIVRTNLELSTSSQTTFQTYCRTSRCSKVGANNLNHRWSHGIWPKVTTLDYILHLDLVWDPENKHTFICVLTILK